MVDDIIHYDYQKETELIISEYLENKSFFELLKEDGVQIYTEKCCEDILEKLILAIDKGRPVVVFYDPYYNPIRKDVYKKMHLNHSILINGYNKKNKFIYAIEHKQWENLEYEQLAISFDDLKNAYYRGLEKYDNPFSYLEIIDNSLVATDVELLKIKYQRCMSKYKIILEEGLHSLINFVLSYEKLLSDPEKLKFKVDDYIDSFNHIINSKKFEKYRIQYLFGTESELWVSIDAIVELWNKVRLYLGRYFYSGIYRKDDLVKSLFELNKLIHEEKVFTNTITSKKNKEIT